MFRPSRVRPESRIPLQAEELSKRIMPAGVLAVGTNTAIVATVRTFTDPDQNGTYDKLAGILNPFGPGFKGGVRVALGNVVGNENDELITVMATGGGWARIWEVSSDGTIGGLVDSFQPFGAAFKGGLFVAAGDLNGDGEDELALSQGSAGNSVRIFSDTDGDGLLSDNQTDAFAPFGAFTGGSRIAMGNTNNTGGDELIVGRGAGGAATVNIYTDTDLDRAVSDQPVLETFTAFANYTGGVQVAAGPVANAGGVGAEVIVGRGTGVATVKIYTDTNANGFVGDEPVFESFTAFAPGFQGGVHVAAGDTDNSGSLVEVLTGTGPGNSLVRIWDDTADGGFLLSDNPVTQSFQAFPGYTGGVWMAYGKITSADFTNQNVQSIPDLATTTSSIFVPSGAGLIRDLDVSLSLAHAFVADLTVTLVHVPTGTSLGLFSGIGGANDGLMVRLTDESGIDIGTGTGTFITGTFDPEGTALLSIFDGLDASGEWQLVIVDGAGGDSGTLFSWSLHFTF